MAEPERPLAAAPWLHDPATRAVVRALAEGGRPVRFVGGCVRDALIGRLRPDAEIDLATPEPPERVMALLEAEGIKVVPTGIDHGTVTAVVDRRPFEITTLRRDVTTDGRRAIVAYTDDFTEDARRRDLTINAMSCDPEGRLFDPFDGRDDLLAGRIRFVGDPRARIAEDHLRILRFFRFHAHYGKAEPDAAALAACAEAAPLIARLSGERLHAELLKLLAAPDPVPTLRLMAAAGVLEQLLGPAVNLARLERLVALATGEDAIARLAALLRPPPAEAAAHGRVAERLRLSRREAARLHALASLPLPPEEATPTERRRAVHRQGNERFADLVRLALAELPQPAPSLREALGIATAWHAPSLPVGGADVLALGIARGPRVGRLLRAVESWWAQEDFRPDREACLLRLRQLALAPAAR